jgi:hypothetical protein
MGTNSLIFRKLDKMMDKIDILIERSRRWENEEKDSETEKGI